MSEIKETVTTTDNTLDNSGTRVQKQTRKVEDSSETPGRSMATNLIYLINGFILILLGFRFILKLLGANPNSGFVDFVYMTSGLLSAPFDNIFGVTSANNGVVKSVFEPSILVAMLVYTVIAWGIVRLLNLDKNEV